MGELIARVDPDGGAVVGEIDRDVAHREGVWHSATHVWVLDVAGRVLLQHRAANKAQFPNMWDISAAGHTRVADDGLREVAEELGQPVDRSQIEQIGVLTVEQDLPGLRNRERPRVYLWRSTLPLEAFWFADGEAVGLAALEVGQFGQLVAGVSVHADVLRDRNVTVERVDAKLLVPQSDEYWDAVLAALG